MVLRALETCWKYLNAFPMCEHVLTRPVSTYLTTKSARKLLMWTASDGGSRFVFSFRSQHPYDSPWLVRLVKESCPLPKKCPIFFTLRSKLVVYETGRWMIQDPHELVYFEWVAKEVSGSIVRVFLHLEEEMFTVRSTDTVLVPFFRDTSSSKIVERPCR